MEFTAAAAATSHLEQLAPALVLHMHGNLRFRHDALVVNRLAACMHKSAVFMQVEISSW